MPEVFGRLEPDKVAELMAPGVNQIAEQVVSEMLPAGGVNSALLDVGKARLRALPPGAAEELLALRHQFVAGLTRDMQQHIESLVDIRELMVGRHGQTLALPLTNDTMPQTKMAGRGHRTP